MPGIGQRHAVLHGADEHAAEHIDEHDEDAGDRIAAHEFARAVHGTVEIRLLAHLLAAHDRLGLRDDAGVQIGVDRHLPAGHRVQGEACAHLGDAPRALGDHDEVDDHEHREHHQAHGVVAADHELAEGRDHMAGGMRAGVAADEHDAGGGDVETEPQQRSAEQHGREARELERAAHVDHPEQDHQRQRDVEREQDVEQKRRQRQHHHGEDHHDEERHAQSVARELSPGCRPGGVHTSAYSGPSFGSGRAMRAAAVGFKVRTRKM